MIKEDIKELVEHVNKELLNNKSISMIEKEMSLGKDTLRKRLNRANYYYNKATKQFEYDEEKAQAKALKKNTTQKNIDVTQEDNTKNYKNDTTAYNLNIKDNKKGGAEDISNQYLSEFKALSEKEKVEKVNNISKGNLSQKELEKELCFTNISSYIDRNYAYWSEKDKLYLLVNNAENTFNDTEIAILKEIISNYQKQQKLKINNNFTGEITTRSFRSYKSVMNEFADFCTKNKLKQSEAIATALADFIIKNS